MVEFSLPGVVFWALLLVPMLIATITLLLRGHVLIACLGVIPCVVLAFKVMWALEPFYWELEPRSEPAVVWGLCIAVPTVLGVVCVTAILHRVERHARRFK